MSAEGDQKVLLQSSDGVEIATGTLSHLPVCHTRKPIHTNPHLERRVAERSMLIKNMIEDLGSPGEEAIPIMNVSLASA